MWIQLSVCVTINRVLLFQLRKAIEEVNSGQLVVAPESVPLVESPVSDKEEIHLSPQEEPLLSGEERKVQNTVTSMDSAISNCSDIEMENINSKKPSAKS